MLFARLAALLLPALAVAVDSAQSGKPSTGPKTTTAPTVDLRQLTADTFKKTVAHGAWLVEHFSPKCGHCRAFAPTWGRLATDLKYLERLAGFHMAQVNCLAQGDLCADNDVKGYPQIDLYIDGQRISEYKLDRNYDFVRKWIEEEANKYARTIVLGTDEEGDTTENATPVAVPNTKGKVVEVSPQELRKVKEEGPVFVDFYAPWCPHCKTLRPTLENLAAELRGKINIVALNCEAYPNVCKENKLTGYPTLRLFRPFAGGFNETEYQQARKVETMKAFLKPAFAEPKMQPMKVEDLDKITREQEVFVIYLQNFGTTLEDLTLIEKSVKPFLSELPVFTSNDPLLYANLSIANPVPSSLLLAFAGGSPKPVATLQLPVDDPEDVTKFLEKHRTPLVTPLTKETYKDIMEPGAEYTTLVVLGAIHSGDEGKAEIAKMETIARSFRRGGRKQYRPVKFVTADETWQVALERMFGIRTADLPRLVVVDPAKDVYYEGTIEGNLVNFDGESAFSVLEGIWKEWAKPKKIQSASWAHTTKMGTTSWSAEHPYKATLYAVSSVAVVAWLVLKLLRRRSHSRGGGYMNEKGFALSHPHKDHRLD